MKKLRQKFKHKAPSQPATPNPASSNVAGLSTALSPPIEVSVNDLRGRLWNEAFDGLESVDANTIKRYKEILLEQLQNQDGQLQDAPSDPVSANDDAIRPANNGRWRQMEQLVEIGLQRTDKSNTIKSSISDKVKVITPFKELIGNAVKASPEASVAWVGVSFALEILANPLKAPSDNRKGLTEVVSNMEWYWGLSELLLEKDNTGPAFEELRSRLEKDIVQLYQKLLLYQMKSVCRFFKGEISGALRDFVQSDDWNGQLNDIKAARAAVEQRSKEYNSQRLHNTLNAAASTAELQHKKLVELLGAIELQTKQQEETQHDQDDKKCLNDLFQTDPRDDKDRIQQTKGGLLRDCYDRILDRPDYKHFWTDNEMRLFWIKGDPGKGKTMLMCGIIDELKEKSSTHLSWFFCQATHGNLSNATAVLRGLIYKLADENRSLIQQHIRKIYDAGGKQRFEDQNAWQVFTSILKSILQSDIQDGLVLVVDALDECDTGGEELLSFIIEMSRSSRAKWIISSRKEPFVEDQMEESVRTTALQLELTGAVVSEAVGIYIREKVEELQRKKKYDQPTRDLLEQKFIEKSNDTFLWVALVCQQLDRDIDRKKDPLRVLDRVPRGLTELYQRMMQQILKYDDELREECKAILSVISVVYRPITLKVLASIVESLTPFQDDDEVLERQVTLCGSFFNILDGTVYFVHQSAKEFLLDKAHGDLQLSGIEQHQPKPAFWRSQHHGVLQRALERLGKTLERDIYRLQDVGVLIDEVCPPTHDPLALVEYFCIHWVDHLLDSRSLETPEDYVQEDDDLVYGFLRNRFLFWVEALSLLKNLPKGVSSMSMLDNLLAHSTNIRLSDLIRDTFRFILRHRATIELAPLQTYASALAFSPTESVVRTLFRDQEPAWITVMLPPVEATWSACMQTLDGHRGSIRSLATSKDGRWLASASEDATVRLWDAVTGACLQTYCHCCPESDDESHFLRRGDEDSLNDKGMGSVTFSDDSQHLASVSWVGAVRIWNVARGLCIRKIECDGEEWFSITYPSDSHGITLASPARILILDAVTGACLRSCEPKDGARPGTFYSLAYSPNGKWLASGSFHPDDVVMIRNAATGAFKQKFSSGTKFHPQRRFEGSMSFSHDSQLLATSLTDGTIKVWGMEKGICVKTFSSHRNLGVHTVAFSADGQWLMSATYTSIEVWNVGKGTRVRAFKDCGYEVGMMALSMDGQRIFSTSSEHAIKVWDLRGTYTQNMKNHRVFFGSLTCSADGRHIASYDSDYCLEIRDVFTNACKEIRVRQNHHMEKMKFSADGQLLMLVLRAREGTFDLITAEIWHVQSGECMQTFVSARGGVALSADSQLFASNESGCIQIRRISNRECVQTLNTPNESWRSMAFSPNGRWFASASSRGVRLWSTANYECTQTLALEERHSLSRIVFSENSYWLGVATYSDSKDILQIWDTATAVHTQTFKIPDTYYEHFHEHFFTHLSDALGPLDLDSIAEEPYTTPLEPPEIMLGGLQMDDNWITRDGKRLLRIPSEYLAGLRATFGRVAVARCFLAWLSHDGKLFWIRFSDE